MSKTLKEIILKLNKENSNEPNRIIEMFSYKCEMHRLINGNCRGCDSGRACNALMKAALKLKKEIT